MMEVWGDGVIRFVHYKWGFCSTEVLFAESRKRIEVLPSITSLLLLIFLTGVVSSPGLSFGDFLHY